MLSFQYIFTPDSQEKVAFSYCLGNNKEYNIRLHTFLLLSESTVVVGVDVCSSCSGSTPGNAGLNPGILPNIVHKVKTRDGERTLLVSGNKKSFKKIDLAYTWAGRQSRPPGSASLARQWRSVCASSLRAAASHCGYPGPFCVAILSHEFKTGSQGTARGRGQI